MPCRIGSVKAPGVPRNKIYKKRGSALRKAKKLNAYERYSGGLGNWKVRSVKKGYKISGR